jgi:hypothetical protein
VAGYRGGVSWFRRTPGDGSDPPAGPDHAEADLLEIEPLTDGETEWVRSTIAELEEQGVLRYDIDDLGRHYDELLTGWLRLGRSVRPDPDRIITQIGLAFGQLIVNHTGLEWGVATGREGVEIALHRPATPGQLVIYPASMVSARWNAEETGMLPALTRATIEAVRDFPGTG